MRSVVVYLRYASESEVADYLARTYPLQLGPPWIMGIGHAPRLEQALTRRGIEWIESTVDPILYIHIGRPLVEMPEWRLQDDLDELVQCLGWEPVLSVSADVSGRHAGDSEVREFVCGLLEAFEGLAQDEYTQHCWIREQIMAGHQIEGHPFFDYQGWYESQHR